MTASITLAESLPPRQVEVGLLSAAGFKTTEIAKQMGVKRRTVQGEMSKLTQHFIIPHELDPHIAVILWFHKNNEPLKRYWEICNQEAGWKAHWETCLGRLR